MKPFVKWAGGKTQLLGEINQYLPKNFDRLVEPFVGGGALFLSLEHDKVWINDLNKELINLYQQVRINPKKLMKTVESFKDEYHIDPKGYYYELRNYDRRESLYADLSPTFKASRTLFLNKTNFNGLYRVNSQERFNTPWGQKHKVPEIYNQEELLKISSYLKQVKITSTNYYRMLKDLNQGDFVYLDPPYDKLNKNTFTSYTIPAFDETEQRKLKEFCNQLNTRGIKFLQSNHNTPLIRELYQDYKIVVVNAKRNINANGQKRGVVEEVLIMNYD